MIDHFSISAVQCYLECPARYRAKYIDGIDLISDKTYLVFGSAMHKALEMMYKDGADPYQVASKIFKEHCDDLEKMAFANKDAKKIIKARKLNQDWNKTMKACFDDFLAYGGKWEPMVFRGQKMVEYVDTVFIKNPINEKQRIRLPFKFIIDLVSTDEDVIDHKTTKYEFDEDEAKKKVQLPMYALGYKAITGHLPRRVVFNVMNKKMRYGKTQTIEWEPDLTSLAITWQKLNAGVEMILYGDFKRRCEECDYCKLTSKKKGGDYEKDFRKEFLMA
jgi:hypothetical protein